MRPLKLNQLNLDKQFVALLKEGFPLLDLERINIRTSGIIIPLLRALHGAGMTLGHQIFILPEYYNPKTLQGLSLLAHELKHVEQYERLGYIHLAARYVIDFIKNDFRYGENLPLEKEAFEMERKVINNYARLLVEGGKPPPHSLTGKGE
jgi:hypothetical protein